MFTYSAMLECFSRYFRNKKKIKPRTIKNKIQMKAIFIH